VTATGTGATVAPVTAISINVNATPATGTGTARVPVVRDGTIASRDITILSLVLLPRVFDTALQARTLTSDLVPRTWSSELEQ
jgi:pyruvate/2-oxoglutarate dehydrogenase complex dihydrolipoamide acyltransferase (E2) component